MENELV